GVANSVVYTWQINAQIITAVDYDGVVLVFDKHHVLRTAAVHAAQADNLQSRTVVNLVGARPVAVFGRSQYRVDQTRRVFVDPLLGSNCRSAAGFFYSIAVRGALSAFVLALTARTLVLSGRSWAIVFSFH